MCNNLLGGDNGLLLILLLILLLSGNGSCANGNCDCTGLTAQV